MRENEVRKEGKKKKIFVLWIDVGFHCNFLIKFNKVLTVVIHTVNYLVYAINGELWKHMLVANSFNYLFSTFTCFK